MEFQNGRKYRDTLPYEYISIFSPILVSVKIYSIILTTILNDTSLCLVLAGYPPQAALDFINAADETKPPPDRAIIRQSRINMQHKSEEFLRRNQDFLC